MAEAPQAAAVIGVLFAGPAQIGTLIQGDPDVSAKLDGIAEASERRHREMMEAIARDKGVDPKVLVPLFEHLGLGGLTDDEIRRRAGEAIEAMIARARRTVEPSNEGADIDAAIGAARAKLGRADTAGARSILAGKIAEEEAARRQRLVPLLEEQAAVERLAYDHVAAKATLRQLLALDPEHVWSWIELGDLFVTTGALDEAIKAFRNSLAVADRLAKADPGNAFWQRDLAVSYGNVAMVEALQGARDSALGRFRQGREIIARLARRSPDNATLPKDLALFDSQIAGLMK